MATITNNQHGVAELHFCLCTKVTNLAAYPLHFAFLGAHGATLAAGASKLIPGDIFNQVDPQTWQRKGIDALARARETSLLAIDHTVGKFVEDMCTGQSWLLEAAYGVPAAVPPCLDGTDYTYLCASSSSSEGTTVDTDVVVPQIPDYDLDNVPGKLVGEQPPAAETETG